jgi:hypothetical protein
MTGPAPTALIVETTAGEDCPIDFLGESADIVYFISMTHSERYGAAHPLSRAGGALKRRLKVDLAPLLTFADANVESGEEEAALESMWQEAAPLAAAARAVADAVDGDGELRELTADFPELPERLRELAAMADWAAERGARVRLTYAL